MAMIKDKDGNIIAEIHSKDGAKQPSEVTINEAMRPTPINSSKKKKKG